MSSWSHTREEKEQVDRPGAITSDERLDQAIIWITLAALVLLPLAFSFFKIVAAFNELKVVSLHLTAGLIAILWLWQIVLRRLNARSTTDNELSWDLVGWAKPQSCSLGSNCSRNTGIRTNSLNALIPSSDNQLFRR